MIVKDESSKWKRSCAGANAIWSSNVFFFFCSTPLKLYVHSLAPLPKNEELFRAQIFVISVPESRLRLSLYVDYGNNL